MKQGEIWYTDLNPTKAKEQRGVRPVVIISGNLLNAHTPLVIVCPLTTKLKHYHGNLILSPNKRNKLMAESEVMTFHVRSISKTRLKRRIGKISQDELQQIKNCLDDILRY